MRFEDRRDAGRRLAERLRGFRGQDVVVLGLPRGGVPVASEIARALGAPLDVLVARKLGAPFQPELGVGAIAEGGVEFLDGRSLAMLRLRPEDLADVVSREREELARRVALYRDDREAIDLRGRTVILVDDGLATGVTARAALRSVRLREPALCVLAAPVCAPATGRALSAEADQFVCLLAPARFAAVGEWYRHFDQVDDQTILDLLRPDAGHGHPVAGTG
jgi:predicted phosphoribosyltransferase